MLSIQVTKLFKQDDEYDATQEVVKAMSRVIKASNYRAREPMIKCFTSLRLNEALIREARETRALGDNAVGAANKKQKHKTRLNRKQEKAHKLLDRDLREAKGEVTRKAYGRRQTEILNQIFATYFRILKNSRHSPLLPAVLQGLSKQAHLIDASFFGDLMGVLKTIMLDTQLGTRVALECVRTGCTLLSGQAGMAVNIDVKGFHDTLYSSLYKLKGNDADVSTALMCFRLLLHERREVSLERVAGYSPHRLLYSRECCECSKRCSS